MTKQRREGLFQLALASTQLEYEKARQSHQPYNSRHEGYAVIKEELDELWDEIKKKNPDKHKLRDEAIQVASTALAFVTECTFDE